MATQRQLNIATQAFIKAFKEIYRAQASEVGIAVVGGSAVINTTDHRTTSVSNPFALVVLFSNNSTGCRFLPYRSRSNAG